MINKRLLLIFAAAVILVAAGCQNGIETEGNKTSDNGSSTEAECSIDADCATAGCSGQLCVKADKAADTITTCEYKEEYGCLKLTSCGCNEGICGWAETPNYAECIKQIS